LPTRPAPPTPPCPPGRLVKCKALAPIGSGSDSGSDSGPDAGSDFGFRIRSEALAKSLARDDWAGWAGWRGGAGPIGTRKAPGGAGIPAQDPRRERRLSGHQHLEMGGRSGAKSGLSGEAWAKREAGRSGEARVKRRCPGWRMPARGSNRERSFTRIQCQKLCITARNGISTFFRGLFCCSQQLTCLQTRTAHKLLPQY